ncbi:MAG: flagellar basal body P-ring protein FlgI [Thermoguttaceae bacterium]
MRFPFAWLWFGVLTVAGCSSWNPMAVRSQSPDGAQAGRARPRLVSELAVPYGMFPVQGEYVGLVVGLRGTGSDSAPSPQRSALLDEMQTRGIANPNHVLASKNTALVLVRAVLRPGVQPGDRLDVEVRVPSRSETTSLRGGHLLETRLKEMALLNHQFHEGHLLALAEGPVMVDPTAKGREDQVLLGRGRILGGAVAKRARPLGLVLKPGYQNVIYSARVAAAINKRFHTFHKGIKTGVAKAKTDEFIELAVHPRYKDNIPRYVQVVRAVALRETATERMERIKELENRLLDPVGAAGAALQLEALGKEGVEPLLGAIDSENSEVRFYAAEALAYLDQREAAVPLADIAREQPAFRVFALNALSSMNDFAAEEQLKGLLELPSAETRYGAFRALWAMDPSDGLIMGEQLSGQFSYHVLGTSGPAMIHVTTARRPEIVLFGQGQELRNPLAVEAGNQIMVTGSPGSNTISVARFSVDKPAQRRVVSTQVDEVIRAIVDLGGTYPDVVQALQEAKSTGALTARFEVDALPEAGRFYNRPPKDRENGSADTQTVERSKNPLAKLAGILKWGK